MADPRYWFAPTETYSVVSNYGESLTVYGISDERGFIAFVPNEKQAKKIVAALHGEDK
jgi:hypothetical protein